MNNFSASGWSYSEQESEKMKYKLGMVTVELQKSKENEMHLQNQLVIACQERDEARNQLQKLLMTIMSSSSSPQVSPYMLPHASPDTPLLKPIKAKSSITESNSNSGHVSSPADSLFDAVSSPELANFNKEDSSNLAFISHPFIHPQNNRPLSRNVVASSGLNNGNAVIDDLVKGKPLPQKGKLLEAVMEAGPLLQTLLIAGPLPRWRNPPPLQPINIPPVSIKGAENANALMHQKPLPNLGSVTPYQELSCGSSQLVSASILNYTGMRSGSSHLIDRQLVAPGLNISDQSGFSKRRRLL